MTSTKKHLTAAALVLAIGTLATLGIGLAGSRDHAEVEFGREHSGSPFPPDSGHDQSGHGRDGIIPRTTVLDVGGSITFEVYPFHQPAVYEPGTTPEDIEMSPATLEDVAVPCVSGLLPDFRINDPSGRIALGPPQSCEEQEWTTPPGTFDRPGRYLVICATRPHFEIGMYGWVIVK